ncbi:hypothetical protein NM688_g7603 [Phlebia brevispora]|uniref:Uncharacterized protein n=1 Tax=Phlebia brevispora TaxID=194682 RepID=A0ACC1S3C0_9APHY|nr:hypothetical protein NM688_g7603 [Phlebia brevispora]
MGSPASVTHGPGLIGIFLNIFLDKPWMKLMVGMLLIADTVNCVFDMWWIYDILINHFMDPMALTTGNWVFATDPAMVGIIASMSQLFFAWRVKVLTNNVWVVALIIFSAFGSGLGGIGTAIAIHFVPEFVDFQKFKVVVIIWLISAAVCDSAIAASLTWHLRKHKTGFQGTDDVLNKIIRLTVQNGLVTALCAIIDLIAFLATPTGLHLAFNFPLAKLYTNSLMSSLNSRAGWRFQSTESAEKASRGQSGNRRLDVVNLSTHTRPEVYVHVESHEMVDVSDKMGNDGWPSDTAGSGGASLTPPTTYGSAV